MSKTTEQSVRFDTASTPVEVTVLPVPAKINEKTFDEDVERALRSSAPRVRPGPIPSGNSSLTMITGWADDIEACAFISGVIDSAAFNAWGSFANMQTGNVVFLALGVSGQPPTPPNRWAKSLIAIGSFAIGVLFFRYASTFLRPLRRSTLVASFALQTTAILVSSILVETGVVDSSIEVSTRGVHWIQVLPISILAFQAAGQIVTSRLLGIDEIPTVVLTTLLCDLLMDKKLFSIRPRWKLTDFRTRRLLTLLAAFSGAMLSGGLSKVSGLSASLWLAAGIKSAVTLCFILWRAEKDENFGDN
ncbi:TPA_exp: Uncharacterized protein A8136_1662 [Trichophyton benhamiae CBS 112371]|nr:TPA_exp: Uncharacterized protein A8136_1662 [Trichophyton benhamiae CBS 112371]